MTTTRDHISDINNNKYKGSEFRLSGQEYLWQHVSQSLNPNAGMTLIIGETGTGKTFWYHKLQNELEHTETIACQRNLNLMSLIKQFACMFSTSVPLGPHAVIDQTKIILSTLSLPHTTYLLIDDATWLSSDAVNFLLHLSQHSQAHGLHIILFGTTQLLQRMTLANVNHIHIHEIALRNMNIKEIEAFISHVYVIQQPLDLSMVRRIHQASGGAPRETMKLVKDTWDSLSHPVPITLSETNNSHIGYTPMHNNKPTDTLNNRSIKNFIKITISLVLFCMIAFLISLKKTTKNHLDFFSNTPPTKQLTTIPPSTTPTTIQEPTATAQHLILEASDDATTFYPSEREAPSALQDSIAPTDHTPDSLSSLPLDTNTTPLTTTELDTPAQEQPVALTTSNAFEHNTEADDRITAFFKERADNLSETTQQIARDPDINSSIEDNIQLSADNTPTEISKTIPIDTSSIETAPTETTFLDAASIDTTPKPSSTKDDIKQHPLQHSKSTNENTTNSSLDWLEGNGYAIQIGLAPESNTRKLAQIKEAIQDHKNSHIVCVTRKQRTCLLLLGPYNKEEAKNTLKSLPASLIKEQLPWIRTLDSIRNEQKNDA